MTFETFFKPFVPIPVAPLTSGITIHFMFYILGISVHKFLYFSFYHASFFTTFLSAGIATYIGLLLLLLLLLLPLCINVQAWYI
jgi:hypothetical protein